MGQEGVLLRAVEAVDLVDEQQRAAAFLAARLAASNTLRKSETPEKIAESCTKCSSVTSASSRATVVLPVLAAPRRSPRRAAPP